MDIELLQRQVRAPATTLIVIAALPLLFLPLVLFAQYVGGVEQGDFPDLLGDVPPFVDQHPDNQTRGSENQVDRNAAYWMGYGLGFVIIYGSWLLMDLALLIGAVQMYRGRSYGLAMMASIVALLPCTWSCCGLGLPFGIWALVVLLKPETKEYFGMRAVSAPGTTL